MTYSIPVDETAEEIGRACPSLTKPVSGARPRITEVSYRRMVDAIRDYAIFLLDPTGRVATWNTGAERIKGYSAEEIIGSHFSRFYTQPDRDRGLPAHELETAIATGRYEDEGWRVHKDGTTFWANVIITAVFDDAGTLVGFGKVTRDLTERKRIEDQLWQVAHYDSLTGLPNRRLGVDRLQQSLKKAAREETRVALLYIDLDNFKRINDTMGHALGDELLKVLAQRLKQHLRESDTVARMGGDEFLVIIDPAHHPESIAALAMKLEAAISEPMHTADIDVNTSCSIGISLYPQDCDNADDLIRAGDLAMYSAKERGKHCYAFYNPEMTAKAVQLLAGEQELRRGFERGELELFYQPQISLKRGHIVGAEALIRWRHPKRGLVGADKIIPVAELSSLIVDIGDWVVWRACEQARAWLDQGLAIRVAVNVSVHQLRRGRFPLVVADALAKTGLPSEYLEVELTESSLQEDYDCVSTLETLQQMGISLSIDDFGTGFSCLNSLKTLPIDRLKIDKSFVRHVPAEEKDVAIVKTIITMAQSLGLDVIAEGIETPIQEAFLCEAGCPTGQGYLYSKPVPASDIPSLAGDQGA